MPSRNVSARALTFTQRARGLLTLHVAVGTVVAALFVRLVAPALAAAALAGARLLARGAHIGRCDGYLDHDRRGLPLYRFQQKHQMLPG